MSTIGGGAAAGISFVGGGQYMPVADLLTNYPAGSLYLGSYAKVNDLWGSVRGVMTCEYDGSSYYWRPQRTDYATAPQNYTGGAMALTPLVTPPRIFLGAAGVSLTSNGTMTPNATNAWPGLSFMVSYDGLLGLFGINIGGLLGGGSVPILAGGTRTITFTKDGGYVAR